MRLHDVTTFDISGFYVHDRFGMLFKSDMRDIFLWKCEMLADKKLNTFIYKKLAQQILFIVGDIYDLAIKF